jgi:hypothetical protein
VRRVILLFCVTLAIAPASARTFVDVGRTIAIDAKRGVDRRVDYAGLTRFGPWDDRNYRLTLEELALLAPDEAEQHEPIPAFFRVRLRQARPELRRSGPAQYPRHAFPTFRQMYGGFLVDGKIYRDARKRDGRYAVVLSDGIVAEASPFASDALTGELRMTSPNGAAESAIKVSPVDTNRVIAGTNGPVAGQTMWYSTNGGTSFTQVLLPLGGTGGDPSVDWSSNGAFAYTSTLGNCDFFGCRVWFYRSNDGGASWNGLESATPGSPRRELTTSGSDKEYIHVDKYAGSPFKDRVYVTWHDNNVMKFAVSADFGNTFTTQAFSSASAELGIGSDITTGTNGEVYYLWPGINSRTIRMRKSTDGGATFGPSVVVANTQASFIFPIPSIETREAFVYVSADTDLSSGPYAGSVYAAWTDSTAPPTGSASANHARIQVARSRDGGATWSIATPHETADEATVDRWHPWLAVGPDGTVHVVYYDTRRSASRTGVDLFYTSSQDGGVTWSSPQRETGVLSPNITDAFEFGDYNGLDIVLQRLIAVFTDNRDETGGTAQSVDVYAAGITPAAGSGAGRVPDGGLTPGVPLRVAKSGTDLAMTWSTACGPAVDYAVYEGALRVSGSLVSRLCSTGGATSATLTPGGGDRYYLVVPTNAGNEGSYGRTSGGIERPPAAIACSPQLIAGCP